MRTRTVIDDTPRPAFVRIALGREWLLSLQCRRCGGHTFLRASLADLGDDRATPAADPDGRGRAFMLAWAADLGWHVALGDAPRDRTALCPACGALH